MAKKSRYAGYYRAVLNQKKLVRSKQKSVLGKLKEMKKQEG